MEPKQAKKFILGYRLLLKVEKHTWKTSLKLKFNYLIMKDIDKW